MKIKSLAANQTVILTKKAEILVSYETPVAAKINGSFFKTDKKWSKTTSKHINSFFDGGKAEEKPQSFFDNLLEKTI